MSIFFNCMIQAPDGENLSRCSKKKMCWYLDRQLADIISEDPPVIRLRFEPRGRRSVMLNEKPNICVVCGTSEGLTRHHIVPYCFVKHMDVEFQVDIMHDILPLCRKCHNQYETFSYKKKLTMAEDAGMSFAGVTNEELSRIRKAATAAVALLRFSDKIPPVRQEELKRTVGAFLNKQEVGQQDFEYLASYDFRQKDDFVSFSEWIVRQIHDYNDFATEWREHFVQTMKPRYMPEAWKADRRIRKEEIWVPDRIRR